MEPIIHKRIQFEDERELRSILIKTPVQSGSFEIKNLPNGHNVVVDLNMLIERVVLAPDSPDWMVNLIQRLLAKFSLQKTVSKSEIDEFPPRI